MRGKGLVRDTLRKFRKFFLRNTMTGRPMTQEEIHALELYTPASTEDALEQLKAAYTIKHADLEKQIKQYHARRKVLPLSMPELIKDVDDKLNALKVRMIKLDTDYEATKKNLRTEQQNPVAETRFASELSMEASIPRQSRLQARVQPVSAYRGAEELPVAQAFPDVYPRLPPEDPALRRAIEASLRGSGMKPNAWIKHVKAYQAKHGGTYKDALKGASKTYR